MGSKALVIAGLVAIRAYHSSFPIRAVYLVLAISLTLVALGPAVVWSDSFKAAFVVKHVDSAFGDRQISIDGDEDCPSSTRFQ